MNQRGFSQVILLGIVAVIILAGVGGFLLLPEKKKTSSKNEKTVRQEESSRDMKNPIEQIPSPAESIQPAKPKIQPELQPKSAPPISSSSSAEPARNSLILPFDVEDISYIGSWVVIPFGGQLGNGGPSPDISFEVKTGTVLRASVSGRVTVFKNPIFVNPEGESTVPKDWELFITIGDGPYWVEYDHVVDVMVKDGEFVTIGQPLARAAPASILHGGSEGEKKVDEFQWGMRRGGPIAFGICPFDYITHDEQTKLTIILDKMRSLGFKTPEKICLANEVPS